MFSGVILALLAMITFGLSTIFSWRPIKIVGPYNTIFYRCITTLFIALIFLLLIPFNYSFSLYSIIFAFLLGLFGFIPYFTFLKGLQKGKMGIVAPISDSSFLITVFLSLTFYGEILGFLHYVAILFTLIGIFTLSFDISQVRKNGMKIIPGAMYALITFFLWGIYYFLQKIPVMVIGPYLFLLVSEIGVFLPALFYLAKERKFIRPDKNIQKHLIACGALIAIGSIAINNGIMIADVSIVVSITKASPIIAVIGARILFGEKLKKYQYASILLAILGVILLSLF